MSTKQQPSAVKTVTVEIRSRWNASRVLYAVEIDDSVPSSLRMRAALEKATGSGADLGGANLRGTDLRGTDLRGAYLGGANLVGADLGDANLGGDKKLKLIGPRPVLTIGPIGSRSDTLTAFLTDAGIHIRAGCFFGSLDEFRSAVTETHGSSEHGREYAAAIVMIEAHASLFGVDVATAAEKQAAEAA